MTRFSLLDYTLFAVYLTLSVGVGLWSARRKAGNLGDYFLAGRGMNSILVAMSILAALFSGISYLAGPADVYKNGFGFGYAVLAFFIATPITTIWMLPIWAGAAWLGRVTDTTPSLPMVTDRALAGMVMAGCRA